MILDTDMVQGRPQCSWYGIPATSEAKTTFGRVIVANIIMIGALVGATQVVSPGAIEKAVRESVPRGTEDLNLRALTRGAELAQTEGVRHETAGV